ncbi:glycoside hydrolase family 15 protein [Muricoccus radiodurans]|uniref:glycoside hydrolase family 15 protein n=1 Tax=Muricoccus radiodurans TaxID=2231721 RepID=UPI003CEFD0EC
MNPSVRAAFPGAQPLDLGVVGNCTLSALVDRAGRIGWMCWPRIDGDPVFCALLDGEDPAHGFLDALPVGLSGGTQRYRRNTAILETELEDREGGRFRIIDFAPRARRPGSPICPPMLVRRLEPLAGQPLVTLRVRPRFDWGAEEPERHLGGNTLRFTGSGQALRVTTDAPVGHVAQETPFLLDRPVTIIIGSDETLAEAPGLIADRLLHETEEDWLDWSRGLNIPFEWQDAVIRSAITLKLCAFEETGGVVAAPTTSIPEAPNTERTWDYRFCWPRDAAFTVAAMNILGTTHTMERFIRYITTVVRLAEDGEAGAELKPVYTLVPNGSIPEHSEPALAGFLGMGPVRVGNGAADQVQNDSSGAVLMATSRMFFDRRLRQPAGEAEFRLMEQLGIHAERVALEPDAGIWEFRGPPRVRTFSAVMCWAGLQRLGAVAQHLGLEADSRRWCVSAARLRDQIMTRFFRPDLNAFTESLGSDAMDASLLLLQAVGFIPADDARFLGTLDLIGKRLMRDGFLLRYEGPDDFGRPETAFLVCSFWYADALAAAGRVREAREMFERILSRRNHLGLLSEDLDPRSGQLWGNFPQAYSHVGLILSANRLSRSWDQGMRGEGE